MPGTNLVQGRKKNKNHISCDYEPFISPNGRYFAINSIECGEDRAGNNVWDIKKDKKVVFSTQKFSEEEIQAKCSALFGIENVKK